MKARYVGIFRQSSRSKILAYGCGSAVEASSILTEMVIGKTLVELKQVANKDVSDALDGLPHEKMQCSVLCKEVFDYALNGYIQSNQ